MMKTLKLILITLFAAVSCSRDAEIQPCPEIIPNPAEVQMLAGTFDVAGADVVLFRYALGEFPDVNDLWN